MHTSLFCFHQDLRTFDNRGLIECIKNSKEMLPIFIIDKNLVSNFGGLEDKKFGFLREALDTLSNEILKLSGKPLRVFFDTPENIIPILVKKYAITKVYANRSYGDYGSRKRDPLLTKILSEMGVEFELWNDYLLVEPSYIPQRKVFTPYFKLWQNFPKDTQELTPEKFASFDIDETFSASDFIPQEKHPYFTLDFGKKRLTNHINSNYDVTRNDVDMDGTSKLSPYLRFGVFSVRQIYNAGLVNSSFISELAWREFWQHINHYFPETKQHAFQENKRHIVWENDNFLLDRFCEGKTGYPIVDASIKQLLATNWMHGRSRMIVASFLTKDLHIDWKLGEAFFKKHLLDYDENVNFGNWQWSASVGADPKPLRIFNPILQSQKFDTKAKFIKKYLPELEGQDLKSIHNPLEYELDYIKPIVDHRIEQKKAREMYKGN